MKHALAVTMMIVTEAAAWWRRMISSRVVRVLRELSARPAEVTVRAGARPCHFMKRTCGWNLRVAQLRNYSDRAGHNFQH